MSDERIGRIVRWTIVLTALWTVPVIIGTAGHFFGMMMQGGGMPAAHIFGHSFALWYPWIPATPAILWVYRRLPFTRRGWPAAMFAHTGIILAIFAVQAVVSVIVGHATGHVTSEITILRQITILVVELLLYNMFIYGGVLAVFFGIDYARRYRDRDLRASQLETQLERARLEALQMQLQPHFLFNALNSVAMLVRRERKQEALDVVVGFSELLRYVLDEAGTMDVALSEEVRFAERYLSIEQVRHRDRLKVEMAIDGGTERALVPNLLLQPLIENALKHGIARRPEGGRVRIRSERRGDVLRVEVTNDGPPLPASFAIERSQGIGLRNLRERLAAFFGDEGRFTLTNHPDGSGVVAIVELPYREQADAPAPAMERAG